MSLLYTASFKEFRITGVPLARCQTWKTQLEVRSLNVTWRRDLWCHRVVVFFLEMCQIVVRTAMANLAALRAAVFFAICEKPEGVDIRPPPAVRGLIFNSVGIFVRVWATAMIRGVGGGSGGDTFSAVKRGITQPDIHASNINLQQESTGWSLKNENFSKRCCSRTMRRIFKVEISLHCPYT